MHFNTLLFFVLILSGNILFAQVQAGDDGFEFLGLAPSPQLTALGGVNVSTMDMDPALAAFNPSLLNPLMHQRFSVNYNNQLSDIGSGYFGYAQTIKGTTFHASAQFTDYGSFEQRDVFNQQQGTFSASETAFTVGAGRQLYERLAIGMNLKAVNSNLAEYSAWGLATDAGVTFTDTTRNLFIGLVFQNMGLALSDYREGQTPTLPFSVDLGITKQLRYLPFRFSVTYTDLNRWNIRYDDPNSVEETPLFGSDNSEESDTEIWVDNFFRHLVFGGEFLIGKKENLRLRAGYNHRLRKELTVTNFRSMAGFSFGAGIQINRFKIDFGRSISHLAGGFTHFSLSTGLQEFKKERKQSDIPNTLGVN